MDDADGVTPGEGCTLKSEGGHSQDRDADRRIERRATPPVIKADKSHPAPWSRVVTQRDTPRGLTHDRPTVAVRHLRRERRNDISSPVGANRSWLKRQRSTETLGATVRLHCPWFFRELQPEGFEVWASTAVSGEGD